MLDIKFIRKNRDAIDKAISDKHIDLDIDELIGVDKERVELMQEVEVLKSLKNGINDMIKTASDDVEKRQILRKGKEIKGDLEAKQPFLNEILERYHALMSRVPMIPAKDGPVGKGEEDNVVIAEVGEKPQFTFTPKNHIELGEKLGLIDLERGSAVAGYRGYYLTNGGAEIAMALMMYAFHKMVSKGYTPMIVPTLVKEFALFGTGYFKGTQYNDQTDEIYQIASKDKTEEGQTAKEKKFLVGTAEPSLLAYYSDQVLDVEKLPQRTFGFSQCYRSEIGSYGKDTKGLYRVHEFMKIEQVVLTENNAAVSEVEHSLMVAISEEIHQELGLPYRKLAICTGDLSAGKYRQYDMEVWMPGLDRWGETGSASNFHDWQSRRLNVRYKKPDGKKEYVHMLNNTVLPTVRPLIAILENFQNADGSITIPEVLRPYMQDGRDTIVPQK